MLDLFRHDKPMVHVLFPNRNAWLGELGISERSNWNTDDAGPHISVEEHGAAARRTEMEAKLATACSNADIFPRCTLDTHLVLIEVRPDVKDGACPSLTRLAVTRHNKRRVPNGAHPERTTMALRKSVHARHPDKMSATATLRLRIISRNYAKRSALQREESLIRLALASYKEYMIATSSNVESRASVEPTRLAYSSSGASTSDS